MAQYISSYFTGQNIPERGNYTFKVKYSYEKRRGDYDKLIEKHPGKIFVILEDLKLHSNNKDKIIKKMCPTELTIGQLRFYIRRRRKLSETESIVLFLQGYIPKSASQIGEINDKYQDVDGFLYISYMVEETFG